MVSDLEGEGGGAVSRKIFFGASRFSGEDATRDVRTKTVSPTRAAQSRHEELS